MSKVNDDILNHALRFSDKFNSVYEKAIYLFEEKIKKNIKLEAVDKLLPSEYGLLRDVAALSFKNVSTGSVELDSKVKQCRKLVDYFEPNYFDAPLNLTELKFGLFAAPAPYSLFTFFNSLSKFVNVDMAAGFNLKNKP